MKQRNKDLSELRHSRTSLIPVSFHDVSADNFEQIDTWIQLTKEILQTNPCLMVIPKVDDPVLKQEFHHWLKAQKESGCSLFCHGFSHKIDKSLDRSIPGVLQNKITDFQAEFAGLDLKTTKMLLNQSLNAFAELDVGKADGFVPPAWHAPAHLVDLCREAGLDFYEQRFFIYDLQSESKHRHFSFPISLFSENKLSFEISSWGASVITERFRGTATRLALHPIDFAHGSRNSEMVDLLQKIAEARTPCTYSDWIQVCREIPVWTPQNPI